MWNRKTDPLMLSRLVKINWRYHTLNYTPEQFWEDIEKDPYISIKNLCKAFGIKYKMTTDPIYFKNLHQRLFKVEIEALKVDLWVIRQTSIEAKRIAAVDIHKTYCKLIE